MHNSVIIDLDDMKSRYPDDNEVRDLISMAESLREEVTQYEYQARGEEPPNVHRYRKR